jgi:molybdopterin adenylyltransferase
MTLNSLPRIGILTISDRASQGLYEDRGGPAIRACLTEILSCPWEAVALLIPDEQPVIEQTLKQLCDEEGCCLVVTTGGTGPARRDVTPEATAAVCDKVLDGFGEQMRAVSLRVVPTAILSRQIAGVRGRSLIVNLPGKSLLHRPDRGTLPDNERDRREGLPAENVAEPRAKPLLSVP